MNKFKIYYFEIITNILSVTFFIILLWLFATKMDANALQRALGVINVYKITMCVIFCVLLSVSLCSLLFFLLHIIRLINLKERRLLFKRVIHMTIWIVLFFLNVGLAYYIRISHTEFFPIINGIAITGYTFVLSILIASIFYMKLSKDEINYFKQKEKLEITLIDELHEN